MEGANRAPIHGRRLEKPALLLPCVVQLCDQFQVLTHLLHPAGELAHPCEHRLLPQVAQHVMAVVNGLDLVKRPVEEPSQVILLTPGGERAHHLVEMQVREEVGLAGRRVGKALGDIEQDAD